MRIFDLDYLEESAVEAYLLDFKNPGNCLCCKRDVDHIFSTPRRTMYLWDGEGEDPNANLPLCLDCSIEHTEQMDYQWAECYSSTR